jgi:hypothetical protein
MKKIALTVSIAMLSGCAYNSTMGTNDRFQVSSTASFFAPSVTAIVDTQHPDALVPSFAGPSIVGQLANAAGNVASGAFIGSGLKGSGTKVSQSGGGASSISKGGNSSSLSNAAGGNSSATGGTSLSESVSGAVSGSSSNSTSNSHSTSNNQLESEVSVRIDD